MGRNSIIEISGEIITETDGAYYFYDGARTEWVPKSQARWNPDAREMTMPEWLAKDRGFV